MMPVLDASVVYELLAGGSGAAAAEERLGEEGAPLWAPQLVDAEVGQALRRAVRGKAIDADDAGAALWELDNLPAHRVSHDLLIHHAWALRDNVSFYDGLYVALAEMLGEPLLTFDARLARSGVRADIEVLGRG